jgi:hypothetical protein
MRLRGFAAAGVAAALSIAGAAGAAKADDPCAALLDQQMTVTGTVASIEEDFEGYTIGIRDTNVGCFVYIGTYDPPQCAVSQGIEVGGVLKRYGDSSPQYWLEGEDPYYCR